MTPQYFRKRPLTIQAWRYEEDLDEVYGNPACPEWLWDKACIEPVGKLVVSTLEGVMIAERGDWIILGIEGEVYPCKPSIFDATYEPVEILR
jgi:hypothetical protein